jgi:ketol-acid reductoisomerase
MDTRFESDIFPVQTIELEGRTESVLVGSRDLLPLLPQAFRGIEQIGVIGWGTQGRAQARNLRDSLAGTDIRVAVGLRPDSRSWAAAQADGFSADDGTLGEVFEVIGGSELVILLISDAAQAELHPKIFDALTPGSTLGLSHGFLVGHLRNTRTPFPDDVNVVGVCPKGMGLSVRRLYEQGSGINASFAVEQDVDGWATDVALAWAIGIGAPYTFRTTLDSEYRSDIFGERGILLGAVHAIVESLYRRAREAGVDEETAFERACETVTGPNARTDSWSGMLGVVDAVGRDGREELAGAYAATYRPATAVLAEIYEEVDSGRELQSVIDAAARLDAHPMAPVEGTRMWQVGAQVRATRAARATAIDPFAAGVFLAVMTAQVDVLRAKGHPWSEVTNESVIEAVDSLLPYMHARGVAHMVDSCSVTARLGTRRWGPVFEAMLTREAFPAADRGAGDAAAFDRFEHHPVHAVLRTLSGLRPPVDIAVE